MGKLSLTEFQRDKREQIAGLYFLENKEKRIVDLVNDL